MAVLNGLVNFVTVSLILTWRVFQYLMLSRASDARFAASIGGFERIQGNMSAANVTLASSFSCCRQGRRPRGGWG